MKKMLILALISLFYIGMSAKVPPQMVTIDKDVGICYVAPMNQTADVVMYVADNNTISLPDSRSSLMAVEKANYIVTANSQIGVPCQNVNTDYGTPANLKQIKEYKQYNDLGFRLSGLN